MNSDVDVEQFALHFLRGRISWRSVPRCNAIRNFGNIISLVLYREPPFQVELFIVPHDISTFTEHRHPDVDVVEFGLSGDAALYINGVPSCSKEDVQHWLHSDIATIPIHIGPTDVHSGEGFTPYSFLSIQKWLHGVQPSSVGLNWIGEPSSSEQWAMLTAKQIDDAELYG